MKPKAMAVVQIEGWISVVHYTKNRKENKENIRMAEAGGTLLDFGAIG